MPTRQRRLYANNNTAEVICQLPFDTLRTKTAQLLNRSSEVLWRLLPQDAKNVPPKFADIGWWYVAQMSGEHRSPKRQKTVLSGGRLGEMTWWSHTNFFRDHLYHCYGFHLNRLDTPSSFSLISENQLIFRF